MLLSTDQPKLAVDHLEASNEVKPGKGNLTETMEHPERRPSKLTRIPKQKTKNIWLTVHRRRYLRTEIQ